jgi:23S rRNA (guanosine2251-2'-O)-methyltransferase
VSQIIYGIHPVLEALKSSHLQIQKILISTRTPHPTLQSILDLAHKREIPVTWTTPESLERMTQRGVHQNVVGLIQETSYEDLVGVLSHWKKEGTKALFLILDGIQDPQNFGSLIRTALGCGVHGIIIPKDRSVGITPGVTKASAGAVAHLPIARVVNIATTLDALKKEGIWVYGAAA